MMTFRMTFIIWDFRELEGDSKGAFRGDFKQDFNGDLLSISGQVQVRSGPGLVKLKFNFLELDSDIGPTTCYFSKLI